MTDPIKLPPLPEWSKMDDLNGFVSSEIRQHLTEYASAAIEADRKRRGEPIYQECINDAGLWQDTCKQTHDDIVAGRLDSKGVRVLYAAPQPPQIPEGYKLVPIEPTEEMLIALGGMGWMVQQQPKNYKAMLEAAPEVNP